MYKSLCINDLAIRSKVVSKITKLSSLYITILLLYYYYFIIYILLPYYYYYILLYINTLRVGSNLIFLTIYPTTYYTIYISIYLIRLYNNLNKIDIFTKLIRQCNNLYKHWYIEKSYISYIHTRTWYITYTCVHAYTRTRTHTYIYTKYKWLQIVTNWIYILSIYRVKIALNYN